MRNKSDRKGLIELATDVSRDIRDRVRNEVGSNVGSFMWEMRERMGHGYVEFLTETFENLEEYDEERDRYATAEVYEWWTVSGYLYRQLKKRGEVVADMGSCKVWGRQCTGQSIFLDGVMQDIFGGDDVD